MACDNRLRRRVSRNAGRHSLRRSPPHTEETRIPAGPTFDVAAVHRYFAAHYFNAAWDLIDKATRTPEEERLMVALNEASLDHWQNRSDCTNENVAVGYWQASRIQAGAARQRGRGRSPYGRLPALQRRS